jgi:hypothetical protein
MIHFEGPIIFGSNEHLLADVCFLEEFILFVLREVRQTILSRFAFVIQKKSNGVAVAGVMRRKLSLNIRAPNNG